MAVAVPATYAQALLDLEARHDELFQLLDALEKRVANVLAQYQVPRRDVGPLPLVEASGAPPESVAGMTF